MRWIAVALALLLAACQPVTRPSAELPPPPVAVPVASKEYSGSYGGNLVWEGVVTMAGDVLILASGRLTIRPGTEVRVIPAEGTQIDPEYYSSMTELLVRGRLEIEGTAERPVRFVMVERPGLEAIAWAGIAFDVDAAGSIRHAVIERAETGVRCVGSSPEIRDNQIRRCRYGVIAQAGSHPKVLDNRIADGEGGVFVWRGSRPYLKGNVIANNDEEGVFVDADSRPWLDRNTVTGNAIGLALYPRDLPYDDTAVTGNAENLRWLGGGKP